MSRALFPCCIGSVTKDVVSLLFRVVLIADVVNHVVNDVVNNTADYFVHLNKYVENQEIYRINIKQEP